MPHYELMVLVKPSLTDEEITGVTEKIRNLIGRVGGRVTHAVQWGKKKLAYEMKREKKAVYLVFRFDAEGSAVNELDRACRLDEQIMRLMTVAVEQGEGVPVAAAPSPGGMAADRGPSSAESHD